ncbi:cytochrome P450 [Metabacillus fastidiosus]|uniref:cytochrome P450 n=1 Tax=Metabacillus fastidiosus TaxID=1458 RepID=UPI002DB7B5EA|nr:cytochrome P450 [Metabacillus fastidiosus]MEC2078087.1 cytochrome P450 [Metabacillus fastidiosus]
MKNINNMHPDFFQNPYPFYDELRSISPLYRTSLLKYKGVFVTGYEEAVTILKDKRFKNRIPLPQSTLKYESLKDTQNNMFLFKNGTDHIKLRMLVNKAFTPRMIEAYRPYIAETANSLLDKMKPEGKMDIVSDFAFPLASSVIARILGVPAEDHQKFREWSIELIQTIDFMRSSKSLKSGNWSIGVLINYFKKIIISKELYPAEDLISILIKEEKMTNEELIATCILLVIAGHETTVNLISNSLFLLLNNEEQLLELRKDLSLMESAVEECLRYESPTQMIARIAGEDVEMNGEIIKEGEHVYIMLGAANRDPRKFLHADQFSMRRDPNQHLAFGAGVHFCLGSSLARLEAQIAISAFLERIPECTLVDSQLKWRRLFSFRSLEEMLIHFHGK